MVTDIEPNTSDARQAPILRILAATFLRSVAVGLVGVLLGIWLARRGLSPEAIGGVVGAGLAGTAVAAALAGQSERIGRKRFLVAQTLLAALAGVLLPLASSPAIALAVAFGCMLNGMGKDRGAAYVIETALLPQYVGRQTRTWAFAWYTLLQDSGYALGAALAGLPVWTTAAGWTSLAGGFRLAFGFYAALLVLAALLYMGLPAALDVRPSGPPRPLAPDTRRRVFGLSGLFVIDALGGGFLTAALVSYFLTERFGAGPAAIGLLYMAARLANAASHPASAWLAGRIGLINTMVFTHIPSSLLLVAMAFAPTFPLAATLFLLRECLVEMDVPARQSYVMSMVAPEERTVVSSITSLVRQGGWAIGPAIAGWASAGLALAAPLVVGAGLKISYDLLLFAAFRRVKLEEEGGSAGR